MIGALVRERRKKLVQQIAVRGVDLHNFEACLKGAACRRGEVFCEIPDFRWSESVRRVPARSKGNGAGSNSLPGSFWRAQSAVAIPGQLRACLAARVGQLNARDAAMRFQEAGDPS